MIIKPERPEDIDRIAEITRLAFDSDEEPALTSRIRASDQFIPDLSLVAEENGIIIGHIMFSKIRIESEDESIPALSLAPVSVHPDHQNRGIGSRLIRKGIETARDLGWKIIHVLGHPKYYPRFGFEKASKYGIKIPFDAPDEASMVLGLSENALTEVSGTIVYSEAFDEILE